MGDREPAITRRALYEMVWKEPVEDVAKRFGLSGRGLAKLCESQSIPVPPRGYWQQRAAGRVRTRRPPLLELPSARRDRLEQIIEDAQANSATQQAHRDRQTSPYSELLRSEMALNRKITVPDGLTKPHPCVSGWIAARGRSASALTKTEPLIARSFRICSALLNAAEAIGFGSDKRSEVECRCSVSLQRFGIDISVSERIRQYQRPVTDEEREQQPWLSAKRRQVREPTGELLLSISLLKVPTLPQEIPTKWADEHDHKLEEKLPEVLAAMITAVAFGNERERAAIEQWEKERREKQRAEEARKEQERQIELREDLLADAKAWREADQLRAYVNAVQSEAKVGRIPELRMPLDEWVKWSLSVADELDPLKRMG